MLAGASVMLAPAASAGTVTVTVHCVLPAGQGEGTGPQDVTIELDKTTVEPGGQVKATVTQTMAPVTSPVALTVNITPSIQLGLRGAATGGVTVTGPEVTVNVAQGGGTLVPPYEGTFNIPASATPGKVELTVSKMVTSAVVPGIPTAMPTTCDVVSGADQTVAEIMVEGAASEQPVLNVPDSALVGGEVAISGSKFTPNGTPQLMLCQADGTACDAAGFASKSLVIDGQGNLSGTATLKKTGLPDGTYQVLVSDGAKEARADLPIKLYVPQGPRQVTLSTSSGPVGTRVIVTGAEFRPNVAVQVQAQNAAGQTVRQVLVPAGATGTFTATLPITNALVAKIVAKEAASPGDSTVTLPFEVVPGAAAYQSVKVALEAGGLTMTQAGTGIDFGSATLNGQAQTLNANLNQVTVVDARGGNAGWSLVGSLSDLTAASGGSTIPAGNVSWTPSCAKSESSLSDVVTGSAGPLGGTASTLCSQEANASSATGGRFTADAGLTLTTPEFAAAGSYTGTLTLTLS